MLLGTVDTLVLVPDAQKNGRRQGSAFCVLSVAFVPTKTGRAGSTVSQAFGERRPWLNQLIEKTTGATWKIVPEFQAFSRKLERKCLKFQSILTFLALISLF